MRGLTAAVVMSLVICVATPSAAKELPCAGNFKPDRVLKTQEIREFVVGWWIQGDIDTRAYQKDGTCLYYDAGFVKDPPPYRTCTYTIDNDQICESFTDGSRKCDKILDTGESCKDGVYWRDDEKGFRHSLHRGLKISDQSGPIKPEEISPVKPAEIAPAATATAEAELDKRFEYWKAQAQRTVCVWDHGASFPSKLKSSLGTQPNECDDGDSVNFNALTCAGGDDRGCDAVKASQAPDGRWWRSPKKLYERPPEGYNDQTTFSNDHALGVWVYIAQRKDASAFRNWIAWMDNNARCGTSLKCIPLFPRYCEDDRCTFKLIDCPLLDRLALIVHESDPICDPLHNASRGVISLADEYQKQFDTVFPNIYKLPGAIALKPEIEKLRQPFDSALKYLKSTLVKAEAVREQMATYARATTGQDNLVSLINSLANEPGYSLHDLAIAIFAQKKYGGINGPALLAASEILVARQSDNAFYEYVAHGPTKKMLEEILSKCPSTEGDDPSHKPEQWMWERENIDEASKQTMYWDCLFVANLYKDGPIEGVEFPSPPLLGSVYKLAEDEVEIAVKLVEEILRLAKQIETGVKDVGKTLEKAVQDAGKAIEKAAQDAGKTGEKAAQDTKNAVNKATSDAWKTGEKAATDTRNATAKAADDAQTAGVKAAKDLQNTAAKAKSDADSAVAKAHRDAEVAVAKAKQDADNAVAKAAKDAGTAVGKAAKDAQNAAAAPIRKIFPHF